MFDCNQNFFNKKKKIRFISSHNKKLSDSSNRTIDTESILETVKFSSAPQTR